MGKQNRETNGIHWQSRKRLCKRKILGGLGFRSIHEFNMALLGKQLWLLITNPSSLCARTLKARYFPNASILDVSLCPNPSFIWCSVSSAKDIIFDRLRKRIDNGENTSVISDPWLLDEANPFLTTAIPTELKDIPVSSLMVPGKLQWDKDTIKDIFNFRGASTILNIPLSIRREDNWLWLWDKRGVYTVKSAYHRLSFMASPSGMVQPSFPWNSIWNLKVPQKTKILLWRVCSGILPTLDNLRTKKIAIVNVCPVCNGGEESPMHLLVACSFAKSCWRLSSPPLAIRHFDTFQDWLFEAFSLWDAQSRALASIIIWKLRTHKNGLVWRNKGSLPHILIMRLRTS